MPRPFYAVIIPLGEGPVDPGFGGGRPGGGGYPDQGLPGEPVYPDQGLPGGRPPHVGNRPPGSRPGRPVDPGFGWGGGEHPSNRPPGGEYPSGGPVRPGQPVYPDQGLPPELGVDDIGPAHPWVPPAGEELPPPPPDIADQVVVAVWRPDEQAWKVAVAQGPHPAPNG